MNVLGAVVRTPNPNHRWNELPVFIILRAIHVGLPPSTKSVDLPTDTGSSWPGSGGFALDLDLGLRLGIGLG